MGKSSGGGGGPSAQDFQTAAVINAINSSNQAQAQAQAAPPPPPPTMPIMPYQQSAQAVEASRNAFAAGLKGQQADILGGEKKKKNKLASATPAPVQTDTQQPPATDSFANNKLG